MLHLGQSLFFREDLFNLAHVKADGAANTHAGNLIAVHPGPDSILSVLNAIMSYDCAFIVRPISTGSSLFEPTFKSLSRQKLLKAFKRLDINNHRHKARGVLQFLENDRIQIKFDPCSGILCL